MENKNFVLPLDQKNKYGASFILQVFGFLFIFIGAVLSISNISNFSDTNLGLMVGIGFLVASVQTFLIGTMIALVQKRVDNQA